MLQIIKIILICIFLLTNSFYSASFAKTKNILPKQLKIAVIFRNSETPPYISSRYINYYKQGLQTAGYLAKTMGIKIEYKFFVMQDLSKLPQQTQEIINWQPNFIIGPNYSNSFLLLKNYFSNILVLSANANDQHINTLPKNFYTLTPLNDQYALAISNYIVKTFPTSNVYTIVDRNCKACFDMNTAFTKIFNSACPQLKVHTSYIFADGIKQSVSTLIPNFSKNDVILMLTPTNSSMVLMLKIANHLKFPVTFIGDDMWGGAPDSELGRLKSKNPYNAIHIIPWSLQLNTKQFTLFKSNYQKVFHKLPIDNITYTVFSTVNSVLFSLEECRRDKSENLQEKVLSCYLQQLSKDPNSFRPKLFVAENVGASNTVIDTIPSTKKFYCTAKHND